MYADDLKSALDAVLQDQQAQEGDVLSTYYNEVKRSIKSLAESKKFSKTCFRLADEDLLEDLLKAVSGHRRMMKVRLRHADLIWRKGVKQSGRDFDGEAFYKKFQREKGFDYWDKWSKSKEQC